jgi:hypothetical protein
MKFKAVDPVTGREVEVEADRVLVRVDLFDTLGQSNSLGYRREVLMPLDYFGRLVSFEVAKPDDWARLERPREDKHVTGYAEPPQKVDERAPKLVT